MNDRYEKLAWFKETVYPHQGALRQRIRRILNDPHEVDDVVAEVLARTFAAENWRDIRYGLAFMTRIARNILIDRQRREVIISFDLMADIEDLQRSASYEHMLTARDELRRLERVIDALPPQPRRAFILRRVQGHSLIEVADIMRLSVSTIEKHLTKALKDVTRALAEQEDYVVGLTVQSESGTRGDRERGGAVGRST
ncbi:RNA polymerase sigma factor [Sphingomonas arantia]|uniref:RNA polymerase sigma factor n=1 Tax=Sphingomonas arantia TaxID=1460676 RepID=A0ABW4TZ98_9SPHN